MGFFPVDEESIQYMEATGRSAEQCATFRNYFEAQGMFGIPRKGEVDYSVDIELDLADVEPSVAGPKRPQDRIQLSGLKEKFESLFETPAAEGGYGKTKKDLTERYPVHLNGASGSGGGVMPDGAAGPSGLAQDEQEMVSNRPTPDAVDCRTRCRELELRWDARNSR